MVKGVVKGQEIQIMIDTGDNSSYICSMDFLWILDVSMVKGMFWHIYQTRNFKN